MLEGTKDMQAYQWHDSRAGYFVRSLEELVQVVRTFNGRWYLNQTKNIKWPPTAPRQEIT